MIAVVVIFTYISFHRANSADEHVQKVALETHSALCAFKHDLLRRHDDGAVFLIKHPDGIPGISRADIERSLSNQQATLDSLAALDC